MGMRLLLQDRGLSDAICSHIAGIILSSFFDPFGTRKDVCVRKMDESDSGFIYNQHYEPYSSMEMGLTTLSHGGCGPIAVYNALKIMGRSDISLQYDINYFEENNGLLLNRRQK